MGTFLSLPEAKAHLTITSTNRDAQLQEALDAITPLFETAIASAIGPREVTARAQPLRHHKILPLPHRYVSSVASVRLLGSASPAPAAAAGVAGYAQQTNVMGDRLGRLEWLTATGSAALWQPGDYEVVFTAGFGTAIPDNIKHAGLEQLRIWWESSKNPTRPDMGVEGFDASRPHAGLHPWVKQQLAPHLAPPGSA